MRRIAAKRVEVRSQDLLTFEVNQVCNSQLAVGGGYGAIAMLAIETDKLRFPY